MANFYWTYPAGGWIARSALHIGSGYGRWLATVPRALALQYSRLVSELNGLPGTHLEQADLAALRNPQECPLASLLQGLTRWAQS